MAEPGHNVSRSIESGGQEKQTGDPKHIVPAPSNGHAQGLSDGGASGGQEKQTGDPEHFVPAKLSNNKSGMQERYIQHC